MQEPEAKLRGQLKAVTVRAITREETAEEGGSLGSGSVRLRERGGQEQRAALRLRRGHPGPSPVRAFPVRVVPAQSQAGALRREEVS